MAIFTPGTDYTAPVVATNTMYSEGAQGQLVLTQPTTNRSRRTINVKGKKSTPTAYFKKLDQAILSLDATYENLPDKSPWETYATNIAGEWNLCANCMPDAGPKKLFRQYNYNRLSLGLATVLAPIDDTELCLASVDELLYSYAAPPDLPQCTWVGPDEGQSFFAVARETDGGFSTFGYLPLGSSGQAQLPGGELYNWIYSVIEKLNPIGTGVCPEVYASICVCTENGAPGRQSYTQLVWETGP